MDGREFLRAVMDHQQLNTHSIGAKSGNASLQSVVYRFLKKNTGSKPATLQPVADFLGVDVGAFFDEDKARHELARLRIGYEDRANVSAPMRSGGTYPVIGFDEVRPLTQERNSPWRDDSHHLVMSAHDLTHLGYVLRVEDQSMTAPEGAPYTFPPGMLLHVRPADSAAPGKFVIVIRSGESRATFKRLALVDGQEYLEALNPAWPRRFIPREPGDQICGVVVDASLGGLP